MNRKKQVIRSRTCFAVVAVVVAGCHCPAWRESPDEGFVPLFNGKDLDGWVVMGKESGWRAKDGVIRSEGATDGGWLRTRKKYSDFIFKVDWKVSEGGNAGVYIKAAQEGKPWLTGYEIQISNAPRNNLHCTGALYEYVAVNPRPDESPDIWHTFEIHCVGTRIKIIADGVNIVDVDEDEIPQPKTVGYTDPKRKPNPGYLGLQDSHAPKGNYIEYRNVLLKEIK